MNKLALVFSYAQLRDNIRIRCLYQPGSKNVTKAADEEKARSIVDQLCSETLARREEG